MDQAIIRIRDGGAAKSGAWLSSLRVSSTAMQIGGTAVRWFQEEGARKVPRTRSPNEIQNDERIPAGPSHTASDEQKRVLNKRAALKELSDGALKIDRSIWPLPFGGSPRALNHHLHLTSVQQVATDNLPCQICR